MLENYLPETLSVANAYISSKNKSSYFVGYLVNTPDGDVVVRRDTLMNYLKEHKRIQNVELFELLDIEGLSAEPYAIRSTKKSFSLFEGDHVIDIAPLQEESWKGNIDKENKVQTLLTTLF